MTLICLRVECLSALQLCVNCVLLQTSLRQEYRLVAVVEQPNHHGGAWQERWDDFQPVSVEWNELVNQAIDDKILKASKIENKDLKQKTKYMAIHHPDLHQRFWHFRMKRLPFLHDREYGAKIKVVGAPLHSGFRTNAMFMHCVPQYIDSGTDVWDVYRKGFCQYSSVVNQKMYVSEQAMTEIIITYVSKRAVCGCFCSFDVF